VRYYGWNYEKSRQCDCHITSRGILDRKKDGEALGQGEGLCKGIPDFLPINIFFSVFTVELLLQIFDTGFRTLIIFTIKMYDFIK
jgi:hypothetical protein